MNRRSILQSLALAPFASMADQFPPARLPSLKVEDAEVFRVRVNRRGNWTIVRLKTSGGISGLGDASQSVKDDPALVHIKEFAGLLRGRSIFDIEWFRKATRPVETPHG